MNRFDKAAAVGTGPAGLTAAHVLGRAGTAVDVYEAGGDVGGLARSLKLWGQTVDLGPHRFFCRDRRVNELWLEVVGRDYAMVRRLTRILYNGQFFQYPLQPADALGKLGVREASACLASYGAERLRPTRQDGTFESWVCNRFGRRLFEIFFKTYSEKLWGISCHELDADFAAQRIKQFSLGAAIRNAFSRNGAEHRTLVDEFAYPIGGTGMVYERMADAIPNRGGKIFLNTPVKRVLTKNNFVQGIGLNDGTVREYDHVISTMPLTLLVERLPEAPAHVLEASRQLTFRNTILVYLEVADSHVCPDQWIYVHSPELRTGRITNFRNWVPQLYGESPNTILAMEYWCDERGHGTTGPKDQETTDQELRRFNVGPFHEPELLLSPSLSSIRNGGEGARRAGEEGLPGSEVQSANQVSANSYPGPLPPAATARQRGELDGRGCMDHEPALWQMTDEDLIRLARQELVATTLVQDESRILNGFVVRIPRCYPVYRRGYKALLEPIRDYLNSIRGLQVIGRYGAFKYNNQDHSILMGILAAENVLNNAGHDLWSVNADYDNYQEACAITETGLVPAGGMAS